MDIPVIQKMKYSNFDIVRSLPVEGNIVVQIGAQLEPFMRLGMCKISPQTVYLDKGTRLMKKHFDGKFVYSGDVLGKKGLRSVKAPFNGYLVVESNGVAVKQEDKDFWLLSGVWGEVINVQKGHSATIRTQSANISFAASNGLEVSGELIVLPNPSNLLEAQYLEKFTKNVEKKVIYAGDHLAPSFLTKAIDLGALGILAGSADLTTFDLASQHGVFVGLFTAFGEAPTPSGVFKFLKDVSNRFVFISGKENYISIPMPPNPTSGADFIDPQLLKPLSKGAYVQVYQSPYFGHLGKVDTVHQSSIVVRLESSDKLVEVPLSNVLIFE